MRKKLALLLVFSCLIVWHRISAEVALDYRCGSRAAVTDEGLGSQAKPLPALEHISIFKRRLPKLKQNELHLTSPYDFFSFISQYFIHRSTPALQPIPRTFFQGLRAPPTFA